MSVQYTVCTVHSLVISVHTRFYADHMLSAVVCWEWTGTRKISLYIDSSRSAMYSVFLSLSVPHVFLNFYGVLLTVEDVCLAAQTNCKSARSIKLCHKAPKLEQLLKYL